MTPNLVALAALPRFLFTSALLLSLAEHSFGQRRDPGPISTGRPDQTTGTNVIPKHTLQLESGLRYQRDEAVRSFNYPSLVMRYGLLDRLELRVGSAIQDSLPEGSRPRSRGVGPPEIGARFSLWEETGLLPEVALTGGVTLPIGAEILRPANPEARLRLGLTNSLTDNISLTYTYGYGWLQNATEHKYAAKLAARLSQRLSVYGEFFGIKTSGSRPGNETDAGILWLLKDNLQLDLALGTGLTSAGPVYFVTTGFSVRLPY
ncbi:transporter [Hymenobacter arizonensis]|uniref:Putative MetA-pathway of phenol degradation n=1 Tax=Hymenobacter arizonensis TaxID=1227077 RepID=A0A1I5UNQ9_HYMAR|nr:transporter [Hymenobacter arizonensis]SFP96707.1 Putative MetA-pathway of phenol degradation [Hymenobacter arizonensis]